MALSPPQQTIAQDNTRFRVVIAGRRFGKSWLAMRELCYHARLPDKQCWYIAPSYKMARQIIWKQLKKRLIDLNWVEKTNETELTIQLVNGSAIALKGADNYDSLRGVGLDFVVLDEFADIHPDAWFETIRPTLSDRQGRALFIGTPKGIGNWSYQLYQTALEDKDWTRYTYTTIDGGRVTQEEVESAKRDLGEREFRQEYLATFETYTGRIYYAFEREYNVIVYQDPIPKILYVGMDFNIDPMSAVIFVREQETLTVIDEIRMFSSNTQEMVDEIKSRYPAQRIWVFPDPAGYQRKTSAGGATDITILANAGFTVKAPRHHTPVRDRINAVNSRLCDATGIRHLFIDKRCKYTIEALERQTYKEGTSQPDKTSGYDHTNDALSYAVDYMFPVKRDVDPDLMLPQRWGHQLAT